MYDANVFAEHSIDFVLTALVAAIGWFISDRLRSMDARHRRAEDKFEEIAAENSELRERLTVLETICDVRHIKSHGISPE